MRKKAKKKTKKKAKKKSKRSPLPNGSNRCAKGQFKKGNKVAVGRKDKPVDSKAHKLKDALINAVTEKDVKAIVKKLIKKSKAGEVIAIKELFDRLWGRAKQEIGLEHKLSSETATLLGLIDGSSKGKLPTKQEVKEAGK